MLRCIFSKAVISSVIFPEVLGAAETLRIPDLRKQTSTGAQALAK